MHRWKVTSALLLFALRGIHLACAAGVGTFSIEGSTTGFGVNQFGLATLYLESTWDPRADDVFIYVTWDPNVVRYVSTDWKVGNSVAASLKHPRRALPPVRRLDQPVPRWPNRDRGEKLQGCRAGTDGARTPGRPRLVLCCRTSDQFHRPDAVRPLHRRDPDRGRGWCGPDGAFTADNHTTSGGDGHPDRARPDPRVGDSDRDNHNGANSPGPADNGGADGDRSPPIGALRPRRRCRWGERGVHWRRDLDSDDDTEHDGERHDSAGYTDSRVRDRGFDHCSDHTLNPGGDDAGDHHRSENHFAGDDPGANDRARDDHSDPSRTHSHGDRHHSPRRACARFCRQARLYSPVFKAQRWTGCPERLQASNPPAMFRTREKPACRMISIDFCPRMPRLQ